MPSYRTPLVGHRDSTIILTGMAATALAWLQLQVPEARNPWLWAMPVGILTGLKLSPDHVDLPGFKSRWWTKVLLIEELRREIPHRSTWSHTPILGTSVRSFLLLLLWAGLLLVLSKWSDGVWMVGLQVAMFWYVGLALSDALHVALDIVVSRVKGWRKEER